MTSDSGSQINFFIFKMSNLPNQVIEPIPERGNLMDTLLGDDRFGELVTAIIVTQLGNLLRDNSHFLTVFAPTDTAFRKAPPAIVERILEDKDVLES